MTAQLHPPAAPRILRRPLLWAGIVTAVVTLIVGALVASKSALDTAGQVQRGGAGEAAFRSALVAVVAEQNAEAAYWAQPSAAAARTVDSRQQEVVSALRAIRTTAGPAGLRTIDQVLRDQATVERGWRTVLTARAHGAPAAAATAHRTVELPALRTIDNTLEQASAGSQAGLLASLAGARRATSTVLVATVFAFVLGMLLLVAAAAAIHFKRRLDAAREHELERMRRAALTDSLTGLGNHRSFHDDLGRLVRSGHPVTLALIDLDGLRQVNDARGHRAGDDHLQLFGAAVAGELSEPISAYRVGGGRFAVLLPGGRPLDGLYFVSSLLSRLRTKSDGDVPTCTAGVAEAVSGVGKDTVIWRADRALVEARGEHREAMIYTSSREASPPAPSTSRATDAGALASALSRAVDAKDAYTHSHCETVAELCALIADEMGLQPERVARVRLAGLLHDVGKIGIPDAILRKPGPLTGDEYEAMKEHASLGRHILSAANLPEVADWIHHHHERVDGCGYPDGLAGDAIPFESRIVMVADAFEAITADRPYRDSRSVAEALDELERHSGTQFDPRCLEALKRVVGTGVPTIVPAPESVPLAA